MAVSQKRESTAPSTVPHVRSNSVSFRLLWKKNWILLRSSAWVNVFLFILFPALLVFMIGVSRFGLDSGALGIGPVLDLPATVAPLSKAPSLTTIAWADDRTTTSSAYNASDIVYSIPGIEDFQIVKFDTSAELRSYCALYSCFAGISFHDVAQPSVGVLPFTANYTIHFAANMLPYGLDTSSSSGFQAAGIASLQLAIDRNLMITALPGEEAEITASSVTTQTFTSITRAQYNKNLYGYYYNFMSLVGAVAFTVIFLPQVFWLTQRVVSESEARLKESTPDYGFEALVLFTWLTFSADFISVLAIIVLNALDLMALALLLAQFQRKARMASLVTMIVVVLFGLLGVAIAQLPPSSIPRALVSLLFAPSGFALSIIILVKAEENATPVSVGSWFEINNNQGISLGVVLLTMAINCVFTSFLTWYMSQVVPGTFGIPKPWNFLCKRSRTSQSATTHYSPTLGRVSCELFEEPTSAGPAMVQIRGLTKSFPRMSRPAVDRLSLEFYRGETVVLLGRNGCGKTTTMSQLVGMLEPTSGDIYVNNTSVRSSPETVRSLIGFCPQHDILWNDLSVKDTLKLFAGVKGVPAAELEAEVREWLVKMSLTEKEDALVGTLSGGQKRRLSLCSAFIGGSQLVILDEPTAGVDPHSRRAIWTLIQASKATRTVLMSTHFLDEADVLGDRIAIMADGQLRAVGSPLFLKHNLGLGHNLTVSFDVDVTDTDVQKLISAVNDFIPGSTEVSRHGREVIVGIPSHGTSAISPLLSHLEVNNQAFGISSFGVNSASLQDVFLSMVGDQPQQVPAKGVDHTTVAPLAEQSPIFTTNWSHASSEHQPSTVAHLVPSTISTLRALLRKRAILALRDKKTALAPFVIASVLAILAAFAIPTGQRVECPASEFVNPQQQIITGDATTAPYGPSAEFVTLSSTSALPSMPTSTVTRAGTAAGMYDIIAANSSSIWGGYLPSQPAQQWSDYTVLASLDRSATLPASLNAATNSLVSAFTGDPAVFVVSAMQALPTELNAFDNGDWIPALVLMGLCMLCLSITIGLNSMLVAREREIGIKFQQRAAGVSAVQYWAAHFLWDGVMLTVCALIIAAGFYTAEGWWLSYPVTFGLFALFAIAATLLGYLVTFIARTQAAALGMTASYLFFVAIGVLTAVFTQLSQLHGDPVAYITYAGIAVNPMASIFFGVMYGLNIVYIGCPTPGEPMSSDKMDSLAFAGKLLVTLGAQIAVFALALLVTERWHEVELWMLARQAVKQSLAQHLRGAPDAAATTVDEDVSAEASRILAALNGTPAALMDKTVAVRLRKEYNNGAKVAVADLSVGFHDHEVFGLLGANGAGKTTTLRMITGQELPTSGDAIINGHSLLHDMAAVQRAVGFCPQFDVLFPELTPVEHIRLFSALRGLHGQNQDAEVNWLIRHLDLTAFKDKPSGTLSGGNRRKLCVAIALTGAPPVLVLDEPSTGMDPAAKRFMWQVIQGLQRDHTTIITTHSMEECEAVSQRIGIMAAGQLAALGGPQHLKNKLGSVYQVDVICGVPRDAEAFITHFKDMFAGVDVIEHQGVHVRCSVPRASHGTVQLGDIFHFLEDARGTYGIVTYQVGQTSLEQVFLDLVEKTQPSVPSGLRDEARGAGSLTSLACSKATWTAIFFNLVSSVSVSFITWGLVLSFYFATLCLLLLPPLGGACANLTTRSARGFARLYLRMATSTSPARRAAIRFPPVVRGARGGACDAMMCGGWSAHVAPLFADHSLQNVLIYQLLLQPFVALLCCFLSAGILAVGLATLFGFPYSCLLQRRLHIWQRELAFRFCSS